MNKEEWKQFENRIRINNKSHNMLIHGYLSAIQDYVIGFGLESTAAFILKRSGIWKEDLIRCQLETGFENEKMLEIIERAFNTDNT